MEGNGMEKQQIIALYDQDHRKDVSYSGVRREVTPQVVPGCRSSLPWIPPA